MSRPIWKGDEIYRNDSACVLIYRGILQGPNTPVAIKEQTFPSIDQANKGLQEAHRAMSLSHPNIMRIIDCSIEGTAEGTFRTVLVSELMTEDLFKALTRKQKERTYWTEQELMGMLVQVVAALSFAERNGVCHRDIKPQNLFANEDQSVVKVGDFGTAATVNMFGERKSTLVGSPFFLSPELKRSFSAHSTSNSGAKPSYDPHKSDVYSLGVTFLYLGTLQPPLGLMDMNNLPAKTEEALGNLAAYGTLQWYLKWMLAAEEQNRAYFRELEASLQQYGYVPGTIPQYQSSEGQVWQPEVPVEPLQQLQSAAIPSPCANCGQFYHEPNSFYCQQCNLAAQSYAVEPLQQLQPAAIPSQCTNCGQFPPEPNSFYCQQCNLAAQSYAYNTQCEQGKVPVGDSSCLGCPAAMKKATTGRVSLPCGHKFHDADCFYKYLVHINEEFKGQVVNISCPRCPDLRIDDKKGLLASAFGSFEAFRKKREAARKQYCTVCYSKASLQHRQDCGHKYCPKHWPAPKQCTYCLPAWRDI